MTYRSIINRIVILGVFALAGYLLARGIYYRSIMGVILAIVAIVAWIAFLYRLNKLQQEEESVPDFSETAGQ